MSSSLNRKWYVFLAIYFVIGLSSVSNASEKESVTLQLKWKHQFQFAGFYAAQKMGYFAEEGLDVTINEVSTERSASETVLSGQAQYGISDSSLVLSRLQGRPLVIVATIFQHSPLVLITPESSDIVSPLELKGKRVMYQKNIDDAVILGMFTELGISEKDHIYVPHTFSDEDLISGKVDAMSAYITDQPYYFQEIGSPVNIFSPSSYGIDFYGDMIFVEEEYFKDNTEQVLAFRRASLKGWKYALDHQEEMVDWIIEKYSPNKTREHLLYEASYTERLIQPDLVELGYFNKHRLLRIANTYRQLELAPKDSVLQGISYLEYFQKNENTEYWLRISAIIISIISFLSLMLWIIIQRLKSLIEVKTNEIRESESKYRAMFESALIGMALNDKDGRLLEVNQAYLDIIGYTDDEIHKLTYWDITPRTYEEQELVQLNSLKEKGCYGPYEKEYLHKNGHLVPVLLNGVIVRSADNEPYTWSCVQNITDTKDAEEKLKLLARVFTDTHEGITITNAYKEIVDVNPAFTTITEYEREEALGKNPRFLSSGKQPPQFYQDMWESIITHGHWQGEVWNRKKSGELYAVLLTISSLVNANNEATHYVGVFSDVTNSKVQQEQLNLLAHYDALTNLPNRSLFISRFKQAVAHCKRTNSQLAICFLDLDKFKPINDNFGHEIGDQILVEVAERIKSSIRAEDTVSRQGGDEFTILLNDINSHTLFENTLERIHQALAEPFIINGIIHNISASSGITLYPDDNADIDTLLRHADQAMYEAKQTGRNCYQLFNAELDHEAKKRQQQFHEIENALLRSELELYYQPKVNMASGDVFGYEALLRWKHPNKGVIPPLHFLPIIENSELGLKVGEWVIEQAMSKLNEWHSVGILLEISINISSHQLVSNTFIPYLKSTISKYQSIKLNLLQLEILESSALNDLSLIDSVVSKCKNELGLTVSLDDFGTGYSSLTHLRNLHVDTIKIDQSFVRDLLDDPNDYAIIDGVIGLADSFNRKVIAEGVETTQHGLMLLVMGCQEAQGYAIAKPMPANEVEEWLNNYTPNQDWIDFGSKDWDEKQKKQMLFELAFEQWKSKFISRFKEDANTKQGWPIMDDQSCHCGSWINRARQEQSINADIIEQLDSAHEQIHYHANVILHEYNRGEIKKAKSSLKMLHAAFDLMGGLIKQING